jgi:hypothetical protein
LAALLLLMAAGASCGATEDSRRVVQASEILAAIERGEPVEYDGVIVEGDLDLSGLNLPTEHVERDEFEIEYFSLTEEVRVVKSPINITNSEIRGNVTFGNTIFKEPIVLEYTNFNGRADFRGTNFSGDAYFSKANFSSDADFLLCQFSSNAGFWKAKFISTTEFSEAKFTNYAEFSEAEFGDYADFSGDNFEYDADFSYARFNDTAQFGRAEFNDDIDFYAANFSGDAHFRESQFSSTADFWASQFNGDADFSDAKFGSYADFSDANFNGDTSFQRAVFSNDAFFIMAKFGGYVDFTDSKFDEMAEIRDAKFGSNLILNRTRVYNMKLSNISLVDKSCIHLTDPDFSKLDVQWAEIKGHLAYDPAAYLALIKNFKNLEQVDDADDCYYEYRLESQKRKPFSLSRLFDTIAWISYGYGVRPSHTIVSSFLIFFLFGYVLKLGGGIQKSTYPCQTKSQNISLADALYFSALTFVSQPPHNWGPRDGSLWKYVVLVEDILGWIFLTLFVITLT